MKRSQLIAIKPILNSIILMGLTFCTGVLISPKLSYGEFIHPSKVNIPTTSKIKKANYPHKPTTYYYDISWEGIATVAQAIIEVEKATLGSTPRQKVTIKALTNSIIKIFYKLNHQSSSTFHPLNFRPYKFESSQKENSRSTRIIIDFDSKNIMGQVWKRGKKREPIAFSNSKNTFDPISGFFAARSINSFKKGKKISIDVFNGKNRYFIEFEILNRESIEYNGKMRKAWKIKPHVSKLTDSSGEKRLREAYLWISDDEERLLLKMESEVKIGSVFFELTKVEYK